MNSTNSKSFRKNLKIKLNEFESLSFIHKVSAILISNGWCGRHYKNNSIAECKIYLNNKISINDQREFIKYWYSKTNMIIYPLYINLKEYVLKQSILSNIPKCDNQDYFWIYNDISYLDNKHFNFWKSYPVTWLSQYTPSESEIIKILKDPELFSNMLEYDSRTKNYFTSYKWINLVNNISHLNDYSRMINFYLDVSTEYDYDEYKKKHMQVREIYISKNIQNMINLNF